VRDARARASDHFGTTQSTAGRSWSARQRNEAVVAAPEQVSTGTASTMDSRSKLVTVEMPSGSTNKRGAVVSAPASRRKRLVYFLNAFDRGGAELGLVFLAQSGFFDPFDSEIVAVCRGSGHSADELTRLGFAVTALFPDQHMTIRHMAGALPRLLALLRHTRPDLVILSLPQANIIGRIAARLAGVPKVAIKPPKLPYTGAISRVTSPASCCRSADFPQHVPKDRPLGPGSGMGRGSCRSGVSLG
jgi:Glycosyl transferase 4-like domain